MKITFIIIVFLGIFIFFLPDLASTKSSNQLLSKILLKKTGTQFESAKFSWGGPQIIKGLSFTEGKTKCTLKELSFQNKEFFLTDLKIWIDNHYLKGDSISLSLGPNFYFPLFSSWRHISAPQMTLRLGKMTWQNFGAVKDLLSILQLKIRFDANIPLWFQDSPVSLKDGILHFERTEFLLDNAYEFAFWNDINFTLQEYHLKIGIASKTLQKVLDLPNLPEDYTISMRLTGPLKDPKLETKSALKSIAKLLLVQQIPLAPIPPAKPVPPSRPPFPWQ